MIVKLPYKALSTNRLFLGRKVPTAEYKRFQQDIADYLKLNYKVNGKKLEGNLVMFLEVGLSNPLSDLSNCVKSLEDCIATHFGFNDRQIVTHHASKYLVDKGEEYMVVRLLKTKKNIDRRTKKNGRSTKV